MTRCRFIGFYTSDCARYAEPNAELVRQYCARWGHVYDIETDDAKIYQGLYGRSAYWYYFQMLERHWNEPGIDWFVKLDMDARIVDQDYDITQRLTDDVDLIYSTDIGPDRINAGVQLIRNCEPCRSFYGRVWRAGATIARGQFLTGVFHEQTVLSAAIDLRSCSPPRIEIYPHDAPHSFNSFHNNNSPFVFHDLKKGADPMGCRCRLNDVPATAPAPVSLKISPTAPLRVVYYCYLVNDWRRLMHEQLLRLVTSGLAKSCDQIWLVTCGDEEDGVEAQQLAASFIKPENRLKTWHQTGNQFELPALRKVHELASEGEGKILYYHSKGVSNQFVDFQGTTVCPRKVAGAAAWREFMHYHLIDRWQDCVELLNSNDVVAAFINPDNNWPHGNFWWTTSAHARTCTAPSGSSDRWSHEAWLVTKGRPGKYYSFTRNDFDFHTSDHPRWLYDGSKKNQQLFIVSATYGAPTVQIDEGRPPIGNAVSQDVTSQVDHLILDGHRLDFRVDNGLFGDPCHGTKKRLSIVWSTVEDRGTTYILDQDEAQPVKLELP